MYQSLCFSRRYTLSTHTYTIPNATIREGMLKAEKGGIVPAHVSGERNARNGAVRYPGWGII